MDVYVDNKSGARIQVVYVYFDPGCPGEPWHVEGWRDIAPSQNEYMFSTQNTNFYLYAEDIEGLGYKWSGQDKFAYIRRNEVLNQCINIQAPGSEAIGLIEYVTGGVPAYTVNLKVSNVAKVL